MIAAMKIRPISPRTSPKVWLMESVSTSTWRAYAAPPSCSPCHPTAVTSAPGTARTTRCCRAAASRNSTVSTNATAMTVPRAISSWIRPSTRGPNTSVLLPSAEKTESPSTPRPAPRSSTRLFKRIRNGFGRELRGTAHAVFMTFWIACPSPRAPYVAARAPTTTATTDPCRPSGRPSWSPMIGNRASAEVSTASWSSGLPWRMKPKIEEASSSSGKIATNA